VIPIFEKSWVAFVDSPRVRRFFRSSAGVGLRRSAPYRLAVRGKRFATSWLAAQARPAEGRRVRTWFVFVGHTKSGGSLLGAMLDAHPDVVCADEMGLVSYADSWYSQRQLVHVAVKNSRREAMKGRVTARRLTPYSLAVGGQHQGATASPIAVGDSRAGPTTRALADDAGRIDRLATKLDPADLLFVHVVRNPFDPIAAMVLRGGRSPAEATQDYAEQCRRLEVLRSGLLSGRVLTVRYEDLVSAPRQTLSEVCRFLGVDVVPTHLDACVELVDGGRTPERNTIEWLDCDVARVEGVIARFDFLAGYGFSP
jgi:hypothetical protein